MKDPLLSDLEPPQKNHASNAISRLAELLDHLMRQANKVDQLNSKHKSHWLIENNDLFSRQLFKTQSDCFSPYVKESKQRLLELSTLLKMTSINENKEIIAKESLAQIEQQISALMNALQSNQTMHQTAQINFDAKKKIRAKSAKTNQTKTSDQYNKLTKTVLLNSHQLYQKLNEHREFERRLMEMVQIRQQQLTQCKSNQNIKLSQEVLALHQRLGRCRRAISGIERDIELAEKR